MFVFLAADMYCVAGTYMQAIEANVLGSKVHLETFSDDSAKLVGEPSCLILPHQRTHKMGQLTFVIVFPPPIGAHGT